MHERPVGPGPSERARAADLWIAALRALSCGSGGSCGNRIPLIFVFIARSGANTVLGFAPRQGYECAPSRAPRASDKIHSSSLALERLTPLRTAIELAMRVAIGAITQSFCGPTAGPRRTTQLLLRAAHERTRPQYRYPQRRVATRSKELPRVCITLPAHLLHVKAASQMPRSFMCRFVGYPSVQLSPTLN